MRLTTFKHASAEDVVSNYILNCEDTGLNEMTVLRSNDIWKTGSSMRMDRKHSKTQLTSLLVALKKILSSLVCDASE